MSLRQLAANRQFLTMPLISEPDLALRCRIERLEKAVVILSEIEGQRRRRAGPQKARDHDHTARWLGGNLNPKPPNPPRPRGDKT